LAESLLAAGFLLLADLLQPDFIESLLPCLYGEALGFLLPILADGELLRAFHAAQSGPSSLPEFIFVAFDNLADAGDADDAAARCVSWNFTKPPLRDHGINLPQLPPTGSRRFHDTLFRSLIPKVKILLNDLLVIIDQDPVSLAPIVEFLAI